MATKTQAVTKKYPDNVNTKIVGVTHEGRQELLSRCQQLNIKTLEVVRDPLNRYDPDAVALEAVVIMGGRELERMRLGFVSNSERSCMTCGKLVDGGSFLRSRTVKCPACGHLFQFTKAGTVTCQNELTDRSGAKYVCGRVFETDMCKTVVCPTCFGDTFTRSGVASQIAEAMDAGVRYYCEIQDFTGGEPDEKGKMKTRGCNVRIYQMEAHKPA